MNDERTHLSDATRRAEAEEARAPHVAAPADSTEEKDELEDTVDPDVRAHYQEMAELGAENVGEGRIP